LCPVSRGGSIALPLLALDGSQVNIHAAGQLAFIVHEALGGDHLSATKTYRVEGVVDELVRKFNVELSLRNTLVALT
jgi:hypothetical protein